MAKEAKEPKAVEPVAVEPVEEVERTPEEVWMETAQGLNQDIKAELTEAQVEEWIDLERRCGLNDTMKPDPGLMQRLALLRVKGVKHRAKVDAAVEARLAEDRRPRRPL